MPKKFGDAGITSTCLHPEGFAGRSMAFTVGFYFSSALDLPRAIISCFLKAVCSLVPFSPTGSQLQLDNPHPFAVKDTQQPPAAPVIGKGLFLVMQGLRSFARPLPHLVCTEISLNKVGNSLLTDRQLLSQLETS